MRQNLRFAHWDRLKPTNRRWLLEVGGLLLDEYGPSSAPI